MRIFNMVVDGINLVSTMYMQQKGIYEYSISIEAKGPEENNQ